MLPVQLHHGYDNAYVRIFQAGTRTDQTIAPPVRWFTIPLRYTPLYFMITYRQPADVSPPRAQTAASCVTSIVTFLAYPQLQRLGLLSPEGQSLVFRCIYVNLEAPLLTVHQLLLM